MHSTQTAPRGVLTKLKRGLLDPPPNPNAPVKLPGKECTHLEHRGWCGSCQRYDMARRKRLSLQAQAARIAWEQNKRGR